MHKYIVTIYWKYCLPYCEKLTILPPYCYDIVNILWQYCPPYCQFPQYHICWPNMLTECGQNIVKYPPYWHYIRLTYMITVLWKFTKRRTILSQYVDNIFTIWWRIVSFLLCGEQCCQITVTILWRKMRRLVMNL